MSLAKAMATVGGLTFLSRIAGFARDILTAAFLGAGPVADAFFVALKLPNFFRRVTAEGAFSVSFVPVYSETLEKDGGKQAAIFAGRAFSVMTLGLSVFVLLAIIIMPVIIDLIAPGFGDDPVRYPLAIELTRITFPYLLLMSLTALLGGVLNAHDKFAPFAFAPVLFNICLIAAILIGHAGGNIGLFMAWGITLSGVLQLLWMYGALRRYKIKIALQKPVISPRLKKVFKLMGPGVLGAGVMQINLFVDLIIASLLPAGAISWLYYADRLNQLPLGIVGIAVGTALLPMLSRAVSGGRTKEAAHLFNRALEICLLLALPAATALLVMPHILIMVLFERGAFTASDTAATSAVLMGYAIGLPAYIVGKVFQSASWARQDTWTPVKVAVVVTILNVILALTLVQFMGAAGIATATGLVGWVQVFLLHRLLRKRIDISFDARLKKVALWVVLGCLAMGVILFSVSSFVLPYLAGGALLKIWVLLGLIALGGSVYATILLTGGVLNLKEIREMVTRA